MFKLLLSLSILVTKNLREELARRTCEKNYCLIVFCNIVFQVEFFTIFILFSKIQFEFDYN